MCDLGGMSSVAALHRFLRGGFEAVLRGVDRQFGRLVAHAEESAAGARGGDVLVALDPLHDENALEALRERFVGRYERLYGRGASLLGARLEIVTLRCRASAVSRKPKLVRAKELVPDIAADAETGRRDIYWAEWKRIESTPIFDGYKLRPGNAIEGPCVVETMTTSMVVHPGQRIAVDALGNFVIDPNYQRG